MIETILPLVCVIDPDPAVRDSALTLFETQAFNVMTFDCGGAFWSDVGVTRPACVIAEADLPDINGVDLYISLSRMHPGLPFALLLSQEGGTALHRARVQGIPAVYSKPLLGVQLRQFVTSACSSSAVSS
jgi:FixJ family two-component response regulator